MSAKKKLAKLGQAVIYRAEGVEYAAIVSAVGEESVNLMVFYQDTAAPVYGAPLIDAKDDGNGWYSAD